MLQKPKNIQLLQIPPQQFLNPFHNQSLSKLTIKLTPSNNQSPSLLNPISNTHNVMVTQSIPLYSSPKFRLALIIKHSIQSGIGRTQMGTSLEFNHFKDYKLRMRALFGSFGIVDTELQRKITQHTFLSIYSSIIHNKIFFHSEGIGIRHKIISIDCAKRFNKQIIADFKVSTTKRNIRAQINYQCDVTNPMKYAVNGGLSFKILQNTVLWGGITFADKEANLKIEIQQQMKDYGNLILYTEQLNSSSSVIYVGYRSPSIHIVLPIYLCESIIPVAVGGFVFAAGLIWNYFKSSSKKKQEKQNQKVTEKRKQQRIEQLKLISEKTNQLYLKERNSPQGLLIQEAYSGPPQLLQSFIKENNRANALYRKPIYQQKINDITVSLRFYVVKHNLKLKKGNKKMVMGFYSNQGDNIYIRYTKQMTEYELICSQNDAINI